MAISLIVLTSTACVGCSALFAPPKQLGERTVEEREVDETKKAQDAPIEASPPDPPKDPSNEDVCRKRWSLIVRDAVDKSKKGGPEPPGDAKRAVFLKDCYARTAEQKKAAPAAYECEKKCIVQAETLSSVEPCEHDCK
ncbi:MAG: hypothetical protein HYV09_40285 [Deltaproteobacteria bacterium]|nr:hypothetical protein [Deltaproteobacteria bacterium]